MANKNKLYSFMSHVALLEILQSQRLQWRTNADSCKGNRWVARGKSRKSYISLSDNTVSEI